MVHDKDVMKSVNGLDHRVLPAVLEYVSFRFAETVLYKVLIRTVNMSNVIREVDVQIVMVNL